jgi:hypothetical protein
MAGDWVGAQEAQVALAKLLPTPAAPPSGFHADANGRLWYQGVPATIGADGTPRVQVSGGDMTPATIESLGIDMNGEAVLYASRVSMGHAT